MTEKSTNIIIGGGPAGIGTALSLGKDCTVLEKAPNIGGLSRSIEIKGAVFDFGGHSFHTPHPEVKQLVFNSLEMFEQKRDARCYSYGELIPYPFQKNYRELSNNAVIKECSEGLSNSVRSNGQAYDNFEEFINAKFGAGIAKHFMLPYNRKLWGRDLKRMAADWTAERVAAPEGVKEKFETTGGKRKPLQANTSVAYPAKGGFGEIYVALGKKINDIRFGKQVTKIDPVKKQLFTVDNSSYNYHNLVSTMAIPGLLSLIDNCPEELRSLAGKLDFLSMKLGLIVVGHPVDLEIQRFYAADKEIAPHKTAINHNSSDYLRSLPHHGVMMEISTGPEKALYRNDMINWVTDNMVDLGIVKSKDEIIYAEVRDVKYSYPVPTQNKNEIVQKIKSWLAEYNIHTLGRFGEWAYINSDKALHKGLELGKKLLSN